MDVITLSPLLVVLAIVLLSAARGLRCPDCGTRLPVVLSPFRKTRRMWWAGGSLCGRCGCETDAAGRKVAADAPAAPSAGIQVVLAAALILTTLGVLLGVKFLVPRALAAPPAVAAPQQAP